MVIYYIFFRGAATGKQARPAMEIPATAFEWANFALLARPWGLINFARIKARRVESWATPFLGEP